MYKGKASEVLPRKQVYNCTESFKTKTLSRNTYAGNLSLRTNVIGLQNANVRSRLTVQVNNQMINDRSINSLVCSGITVQVYNVTGILHQVNKDYWFKSSFKRTLKDNGAIIIQLKFMFGSPLENANNGRDDCECSREYWINSSIEQTLHENKPQS